MNPEFPSLNLAQCVLLTAYEWRRASASAPSRERDPTGPAPASHAEVEHLASRYEDRLQDAGFFFPPEKAAGMKQTLRNLWSRMPLTSADVQVLHGNPAPDGSLERARRLTGRFADADLRFARGKGLEMSRKRSIFEEVDEGAERAAVPAGGAIDGARKDARGAIRLWLSALGVLVVLIVVVGGMTRLTDSGLSITEWQPVSGALPPMNAEAWEAEFEKYRQIPRVPAPERRHDPCRIQDHLLVGNGGIGSLVASRASSGLSASCSFLLRAAFLPAGQGVCCCPAFLAAFRA